MGEWSGGAHYSRELLTRFIGKGTRRIIPGDSGLWTPRGQELGEAKNDAENGNKTTKCNFAKRKLLLGGTRLLLEPFGSGTE